MKEIISGGATTILVSHSIAQVRQVCNKVLWLHRGRQVAFTDDVAGACDSYEEFLKSGGGPIYDPVAARRRIEARNAEKLRKQNVYEKMKSDAARLLEVEQELEKHRRCLAKVRLILKGSETA